MVFFLILPKHVKTREPEDKHCVSWCIYTYIYMCDTLPLDNLKIYSHLALLYITWGLIWNSKIRKKESLVLRRFCLQTSEIPIKNF